MALKEWEKLCIKWWKGSWYVWDGKKYQQIADTRFKGGMNLFIDRYVDDVKEQMDGRANLEYARETFQWENLPSEISNRRTSGRSKPRLKRPPMLNLTRNVVDDVVEGFRSHVELRSNVNLGEWLLS